jgi:hypothetical protein
MRFASVSRPVAALGATFDDGKSTLLAVVTDDARDRGVRADAVIMSLRLSWRAWRREAAHGAGGHSGCGKDS